MHRSSFFGIRMWSSWKLSKKEMAAWDVGLGFFVIGVVSCFVGALVVLNVFAFVVPEVFGEGGCLS